MRGDVARNSPPDLGAFDLLSVRTGPASRQLGSIRGCLRVAGIELQYDRGGERFAFSLDTWKHGRPVCIAGADEYDPIKDYAFGL